jgi:ELWxxDGT repeat protein
LIKLEMFMNPGIGVALVFILSLVLAIISTAQAFSPFARQLEAARDPAVLAESVAGEARRPADFASIGQQTFAHESAHGREVWRTDVTRAISTRVADFDNDSGWDVSDLTALGDGGLIAAPSNNRRRL